MSIKHVHNHFLLILAYLEILEVRPVMVTLLQHLHGMRLDIFGPAFISGCTPPSPLDIWDRLQAVIENGWMDDFICSDSN